MLKVQSIIQSTSFHLQLSDRALASESLKEIQLLMTTAEYCIELGNISKYRNFVHITDRFSSNQSSIIEIR